MRICIFSCRPFEDTFDNAQWRKIKQKQSMWLCFFTGRRFEDTLENAQWRKIKQMQPMWLCLFSCKPFEETFHNAQWRKAKQMQPMRLCLFSGRWFEEKFKNTQWKKVKIIAANANLPLLGLIFWGYIWNKHKWNYTTLLHKFRGYIRKHAKMKATFVTMSFFRMAIWGDQKVAKLSSQAKL